MQKIRLEKQDAAPVDDATKAAIEEAQAQFQRGEGISLEEARIIVRKQYQAFKKAQKEVLTA